MKNLKLLSVVNNNGTTYPQKFFALLFLLTSLDTAKFDLNLVVAGKISQIMWGIPRDCGCWCRESTGKFGL